MKYYINEVTKIGADLNSLWKIKVRRQLNILYFMTGFMNTVSMKTVFLSTKWPTGLILQLLKASESLQAVEKIIIEERKIRVEENKDWHSFEFFVLGIFYAFRTGRYFL